MAARWREGAPDHFRIGGHVVNVCGILVHTAPDMAAHVAAAIAQMPGADVHGDAPDGRLIVTTIDTGDVLAIDQLTAIHRLPGVVAASLVYHQLDADLPDAAEGHACSCGGQGNGTGNGTCKNSSDTHPNQPLTEGFHHG